VFVIVVTLELVDEAEVLLEEDTTFLGVLPELLDELDELVVLEVHAVSKLTLRMSPNVLKIIFSFLITSF
jgi:hypothetical protein